MPSLAAALGLGAALWGWYLGSRPLSDNSFFTHLATGRLILDERSVPTSDPYSFTAEGTAWVVQSWLASAIFAGVEMLAGPFGLQLLVGALGALLAALAWRLSRPAEQLFGRVAVTAAAVGVGAGFWTERPLLFGLVLLGLTLLVLDETVAPVALLPMMWFWVNTHGSYPLGLVLVAVVLLGRRLDASAHPRERRIAGCAVLGTLLGALNPLGARVLTFPVELLGRSDVLAHVTEWQAPTFTSWPQRAFLLLLVAAVVGAARTGRREHLLAVAVFVPAALLGARNVPVASLVLVPVAAHGLRGIGTLRGEERSPLTAAACVALAVVLVVLGVRGSTRAHYDFGDYPVAALAVAEQERPGARLAASDRVGNLRGLLAGEDAGVFIDDRVDMYPRAVIDDAVDLLSGTGDPLGILDERSVDLALYRSDGPLVSVLRASPRWRVLYTDERWSLAGRR